MASIVRVKRSAIVRGKPDSTFSGVHHPVELLSKVLTPLVGPHAKKVDDVITGCVTPVKQQGANVARLAALKSGFPVEVPGFQLNRMCGSGQQAVHNASQAVLSGDADLVVASGVEMMGTVQMGSDTDLFNPEPTPFKNNFPHKLLHQGVSAELLAEKYGVNRAECDVFAIESHRRAFEAQKAGVFDDIIVPITNRNGEGQVIDEGVRYPVDEDKLASLKTIFKENGVVTAGNASQISDGAAAVLVASEGIANELSLPSLARITHRVVVGSDPVVMLDGVIPATQKVLAKANLTVSDIDIFEVNEAFACVALAWLKEIGADHAKVNPYGGAIARGHPLGGTGAMLSGHMAVGLQNLKAKLLKEGKSDKKVLYGLQTMCIGHGMATATIFQTEV